MFTITYRRGDEIHRIRYSNLALALLAKAELIAIGMNVNSIIVKD